MDKKFVFEHLLEKGLDVIVVAQRTHGSLFPQEFGTEIRLDYGLNMVKPIRDLVIDRDGIGATLSIHNSPTYTFLAWRSIMAIACAAVSCHWPAESDIQEAQKPPRNGLRLV